jgi:uncharacterized damage-inducible protein DinB
VITAAYASVMADYNAEMNRRIYDAAARISDVERRADRGAFWGSIHGTLNHLVWGDGVWMARFAGWAKPEQGIRDSAGGIADFAALRATRARMDRDILAWTESLEEDWLAEEMSWFSMGAGRELHRPRGLLLTHFFNHQTHHRGQVHTMLTAAGQDTGDTDLFLLVA